MSRQTPQQAQREIMRRVQVGLVGLLGVLMLVGLTNVVVENVRKDAVLSATGAAAGTTANAAAPTSEPLADLGVAPAPESAAPSIPDLEPDPRLQRPMDRDPRAGQDANGRR